jgi:hypothetical protein
MLPFIVPMTNVIPDDSIFVAIGLLQKLIMQAFSKI